MCATGAQSRDTCLLFADYLKALGIVLWDACVVVSRDNDQMKGN